MADTDEDIVHILLTEHKEAMPKRRARRYENGELRGRFAHEVAAALPSQRAPACRCEDARVQVNA